jgi:uncharacterized membrane protein YcfT
MEEKAQAGSNPAPAQDTAAEIQDGKRNVWIFTVYAISFLIVVGIIAFLTLAK